MPNAPAPMNGISSTTEAPSIPPVPEVPSVPEVPVVPPVPEAQMTQSTPSVSEASVDSFAPENSSEQAPAEHQDAPDGQKTEQ